LGKSAPRFGLDTQYDYFTRRAGSGSLNDEMGHRLLVAPSFFWQTNLGNVFSLKTSGQLDFAAYAPQGHRPTATGKEEQSFSTTLSGEVRLEFSTTLSRVYYHKGEKATLHQFTPSLSFVYRSAPDESFLPYFDSFDRHLNLRTLRVGFWNNLIRRTVAITPNAPQTYNYHEFLRVGVFYTYEFASNLEWAEKTYARYYTTGYFDRGVGPFEIEIEANFTPYLTARILSSLDGRTGIFTSHDLSLTLKDDRGDSLKLIYDQENPRFELGPVQGVSVNQIRGELVLQFGRGFSSFIATRYDFLSNHSLETQISLRYNTQCYGFSLVWEDSNGDKRVAFMIDLLGLGSFGNSSSISQIDNSYLNY
jgi:hypothetical protein